MEAIQGGSRQPSAHSGEDSAVPSGRPSGTRESSASAPHRGRKPPQLVAPDVQKHHKTLEPKFTNYRGYTRCKYCSVLLPPLEVGDHLQICALVPMRCELQDTETGEPCHRITRGRQLMVEHQQQCPMRVQKCPNAGCDKEVSVQSMAFHLQRCNFMAVECPSCRKTFMRNDFETHQRMCAEEIIACPIGCETKMRRGDVLSHVHNTASTHVKCCTAIGSQLIPDDDPRAIYKALVKRINELEDRIDNMIRLKAERPATTSDTQLTSRSSVAAQQLVNVSTKDKVNEAPTLAEQPIRDPPQLSLLPLPTEEHVAAVHDSLNKLVALMKEKCAVLHLPDPLASKILVEMRSDVSLQYEYSVRLATEFLAQVNSENGSTLHDDAELELVRKELEDARAGWFQLKSAIFQRMWPTRHSESITDSDSRQCIG